MADREKVIKGLEVCMNTEYGELCPDECPYNQDICLGSAGLMADGLELLKDPDLVKIVRCRDCRYWEPPTKDDADDGCTYGQCEDTGAGTDMNDFCSWGERK